MHKFQGYDSFMATYINDDYQNLKSVPGLRIEEVPKISGNWEKDSCAWLRKNARRIDVLNIYHLGSRSFYHALTYKVFNPTGKVYLKLDGWPTPWRKRAWMHVKAYLLTRICKSISTEYNENVDKLSKAWRRNIICVHNPFNPEELREFKNFSERSDVILTVGRLGTKQKATEILLEAFAKINAQIPNWSLKLVGNIEENLGIADEFYARYPELKSRVIFTGNISDRNEITEIYRDAKIFAFPSRGEGCPLSLSEALVNGDFAVVSTILPNEFMTENFRFALASKVDDVDGLAQNLLYACTHEHEIEALAREGRNSAIKRCDLKHISAVIQNSLQ